MVLHSEDKTFAQRVVDVSPVPGLRLLMLKTQAKDIVTITGSFLGGDMFSPSNESMLAEMVVRMLDEGTSKHSKEQLSEALESVGASVSFACGKGRVSLSAACLKKDVPLVMDLLAEQLREPTFPEANLETDRKRLLTSLEQSKERPGTLAFRRLMGVMYPEGHPNHIPDLQDEIASAKRLSVRDIRSFFESNFGLGSFILSVAGDIEPEHVRALVEKSFSGFKKSPLALPKVKPVEKIKRSVTEYVTVPEKTSVSMRIGSPLGIMKEHPDYFPLEVAIYILGAGFTSRLLQTVREQKGLTYGIGAGISGDDSKADVFWAVNGTFAPELLAQGIEATMAEIDLWAAKGVSDKEVQDAKTGITGGYIVGLATTAGLSGAMLGSVQDWETIAFMDKFPGIISAITPEQVNDVIKKYIDPQRVVTVIAGSVDKEGKPLRP